MRMLSVFVSSPKTSMRMLDIDENDLWAAVCGIIFVHRWTSITKKISILVYPVLFRYFGFPFLSVSAT